MFKYIHSIAIHFLQNQKIIKNLLKKKTKIKFFLFLDS